MKESVPQHLDFNNSEREDAFMLKRISSIIIIVGVIFMSSCSSLQNRISRLLMTSDERAANKCFEQVVKALEKQDKEAIKDMFSKQALEEAEDFDENLDRLFEIFDGKLKPDNFDMGCVSESIEFGKKEKEIKVYFDISIDGVTYSIFLVDYPVNTLYPDNAGLYTLRVSSVEEELSWQEKRIPGIYIAESEE